MANRHKKSGGKVSGGVGKIGGSGQNVVGNADVVSGAKKKNAGGSVGSPAGFKRGGRLDKYARGGKVGGGGGDCTKSPFTAAHIKTNGDA